ncbi:MAG: orotidine-5'-phosphate decarboxylase [Thermomicrobiales bacterium]|jgi:orotidine-5'-phosphate decarboxylase|nr:orotidine-5'-phosphate decarboxylase [Thermomicrobiales bacterium]
MTFRKKIDAAATRANSLLCIGLDPSIESYPGHLVSDDIAKTIVDFNSEIINATSDLVCAYKPNLGFYVAYGLPGLQALVETRNLIDPSIPVILDCKLGDFFNTSASYAEGLFGAWDFDAVTIAPYMGEDGLAPFMADERRGVFVLCKTSNPGSGEFQDVPIAGEGPGEALFERVAARSRVWNDTNPASVGLVVGATYPDHLRRVREICPDQLILMPGIGQQQGDLRATVEVGVDANGLGLIPNASRSVTYVSKDRDFASSARSAAEQIRKAINEIRGA